MKRAWLMVDSHGRTGLFAFLAAFYFFRRKAMRQLIQHPRWLRLDSGGPSVPCSTLNLIVRRITLSA